MNTHSISARAVSAAKLHAPAVLRLHLLSCELAKPCHTRSFSSLGYFRLSISGRSKRNTAISASLADECRLPHNSSVHSNRETRTQSSRADQRGMHTRWKQYNMATAGRARQRASALQPAAGTVSHSYQSRSLACLRTSWSVQAQLPNLQHLTRKSSTGAAQEVAPFCGRPRPVGALQLPVTDYISGERHSVQDTPGRGRYEQWQVSGPAIAGHGASCSC